MGVGDEDDVNLAQRLELFEACRRLGVVGQPGINDDDLATGRGDASGSLAEPQDFGLAGGGRGSGGWRLRDRGWGWRGRAAGSERGNGGGEYY
ncbi:hypothetical protein D3C72_1842740 [compost metagenome]